MPEAVQRGCEGRERGGGSPVSIFSRPIEPSLTLRDILVVSAVVFSLGLIVGVNVVLRNPAALPAQFRDQFHEQLCPR